MRVGRIAGVELRVHWSTVVIFGLLTWSLAAVRFPDRAPEASSAAHLVAALVAGLAFYGGLVAHEVSHAVAAQHAGIEVRSMTLWLLGGVAELEGEPSTPRDDLRIAAIGPAVSLAIAVVAGGVAVGLEAAGASELVVATVAWLAGINLVLGLFNLVPAAPLDGGRILRAALWSWRGNRRWATTTAARAGEAFGYVLVGIGLLSLFVPGGGGLWFLVLGWFIINAARAERAQAELRDVLAGVVVADVMSADPVVAPADASVSWILDEYVLGRRHSAFPLAEPDGSLAGLITLDRLRDVPPGRRDTTSVRAVACGAEAVATTRPHELLTEVLPRLNECGDGRVVVLDGDRIVGVVTPTDIARAVEHAGLVEVRSGPRGTRSAGTGDVGLAG